MRGLFTGDLQASWDNLDECKLVWRRAVKICITQKLDFICVCGDLKHQYNPVDVRVTKFWIWAVDYAKSKGVTRVIVVLGNHDRVGQYTDAQNWLPILVKAGAECFDKPATLSVGDGKLFILPFRSSNKETRQHAAWLASLGPNKKKDVLVYHADLKGCRYSYGTKKSESKLRPKDLLPDHYLAVVGGHIHLPQKVRRNVYYTGSPFCSDWGEANQEKTFLVIKDGRIEFLPTHAPVWYDPSYKNFKRPRDGNWHGCRVRIKLHCDSRKDYGRQIRSARRAAKRDYPGARIFVVPKFVGQEDTRVKIKASDSDKRKIRAYVEETLPSRLDKQKEKIVAYLSHILESVSHGAQVGSGVTFVKAWGRNFLSFKSCEIDYRRPGVYVVRGINEDWSGRSNGSGKTTYLQPPAVAICGTTFKGQKHDHWARRGTSHEAQVGLRVRDHRGRTIDIVRTRRPGTLRLAVDGRDQSAGLRSTDKSGTQGQIEKITGFTWQTLANAVYIDPSVTHAFLNGTRKERTDILSRFQNLGRFEIALEEIKRRQKSVDESLSVARASLDVYDARTKDAKHAIKDAKESARVSTARTADKLERVRRLYRALKKDHSDSVRHTKHKLKQYESDIDKYSADIEHLESHVREINAKKSNYEHRLDEADDLKGKTSCPMCYQTIDVKYLEEYKDDWKARIKKYDAMLEATRYQIRKLSDKKEKVEDEAEALSTKTRELRYAVDSAKDKVVIYEDQLATEKKAGRVSVYKYRRQLRKLRRGRLMVKRYLRVLDEDMSRLDYCKEAFSRDGIPAFLNAQLCPVLNQAAAYYAKLFGDNYIQIRFEMVDGEFEPIVINASGGESIDDQSVGEKALAGLVASFALREAAPATNLLILDEPGEGLDAANVRQFARALPVLQKRFGTILITSHNVNLLQELPEDNVITIVKKNGISRVQ